MPRPKKPGSAEPKKRSRNGCWPCKNRKIKCGEERPKCQNCEKQGETCDYSIRLNWEGRTKRKGSNENHTTFSANSPPLRLERSVSGNSDSTARGSTPNPTGGYMINQFANANQTTLQAAPTPSHRDHISTAQLSRIRDQSTGSYPSPANSSLESPPLLNVASMPFGGHHHSFSNPEMPPPFQNSQLSLPSQDNIRESSASGLMEHKSKRVRLSPSLEHGYNKNRTFAPNTLSVAANPNSFGPLKSPPALRYQSSSPSNTANTRMPPTPAASSIGSEDNHSFVLGPSPQIPQENNDFRRLSVKSLLSDDSPADSASSSDIFPGKLNTTNFASTQKTVHGVDRGFPDLDIPNNHDKLALNGVTPTLGNVTLDRHDTYLDSDINFGFGFGLNTLDGFQEGSGYYAKPVTVSISKALEPLPAILTQNPMNLLYFHHFLNHTARILVPHDCSENPFKSLLPQMAIKDTNLMNLMLAYSASHRSRLLNHPEPNTRIAHWVQDVFPSLRRALDDPSRQISNSTLATAIMLASLQILNPNTFAISVPWQQHLHVARQMIVARGGANSVQRKDRVSYFLTRWFAYLDVLGSLSGAKNDQPLFSGNYWAIDNSEDGEQDYQIDCLLGFTSRLVSILARIAELAHTCDIERIDGVGNVNRNWRPPRQFAEAAEKLKTDLMEARMHRYQGCPHRRASTQIEDDSYAVELVTTNEAFHHAGLIHVNRRVLGKARSDPEVQIAVREIVCALYKVRKGGTAEGCLLFPMFTAGCEAVEPGQRERIMERLQRMEGLGMSQVRKARLLMEKVWETGREWETLVTGEFFFG